MSMSEAVGVAWPVRRKVVKILNIAVGHKADYSELERLMQEYKLTDTIPMNGTEGYHGGYTIFILQKEV